MKKPELWQVLNSLDELESVRLLLEHVFPNIPETEEALCHMTRALAILHAFVKEK